MKTFKSVTLLLLAFLLIQLKVQSQESQAPVKKDTKVVIIKKTIDEDGNEVVEKIVKEGAAAKDIHIIDNDGEKMDISIEEIISGDGDDKDIQVIVEEGGKRKTKIIHIDEEVEIDDIESMDIVDNGAVKKQIHIKMKNDSGEDVDFEWSGDGEIPDDVKKTLEENGINWEDWSSDNVEVIMLDDTSEDKEVEVEIMEKKKIIKIKKDKKKEDKGEQR